MKSNKTAKPNPLVSTLSRGLKGLRIHQNSRHSGGGRNPESPTPANGVVRKGTHTGGGWRVIVLTSSTPSSPICSIVRDKQENTDMLPRLDRHRHIQIEVSDYGPIAEAKVDLRPLTVFVGPSNTGKSYLAILIYALHRFFSGASTDEDMPVRAFQRPPSGPFHFSDPVVDEEGLREAAKTLMDWIQQLPVGPTSRRREEFLPEGIATIIRPYLRPNEVWNDMFPRELARCFGTPDAHWLIRHGTASTARISVSQLSDESQRVDNSFMFGLSDHDCISSGLVSDTAPLHIQGDYASVLLRRLRFMQSGGLDDPMSQSRLSQSLIQDVAAYVGAAIVSPLSRPAHYLPADRTGVMHAHQVVVASMISSAPRAGLRPNVPLPNLSGVLSDFLVQLLSLGNADRDRRPRGRTGRGSSIETKMLLGTIQVDRSNPYYPTFSYLPEGWKDGLPLMNSSSMVSELAPIVLYLRHVVQPGGVLIIEEPESNLHPSMQVEFIRQLAGVLNSGVRVMVTTHSEWVLEELANLVRLSDIDAAKRPETLRAEPALDKRDVGVWLFEKEQGDSGSRVKEIPLDTDEGGFASGYDQIARLTYNQWATIQNVIEG